MARGRRRGGPDPFLDLKILLFGGGAVLAAAGMITGRGLLVWIAFVPLAVAFLLRFLRPKKREAEGTGGRGGEGDEARLQAEADRTATTADRPADGD